MSDVLVVRPGVVIPADTIEMRAIRSGGPGGQNVNKVASKVELRVDPVHITGLDDGARARLQVVAARVLDADGRLLVTSQRTRDQRANLEDAREKLRSLILRALVKPRPRKKTRPTRSSIERRIRDKKQRADIKAGRRDSER
ncbi:MAG: alternative ribosome rescue aminoacyl-tRNA hydrolase ArfB [Polyangiaceae bacterium]